MLLSDSVCTRIHIHIHAYAYLYFQAERLAERLNLVNITHSVLLANASEELAAKAAAGEALTAVELGGLLCAQLLSERVQFHGYVLSDINRDAPILPIVDAAIQAVAGDESEKAKLALVWPPQRIVDMKLSDTEVLHRIEVIAPPALNIN